MTGELIGLIILDWTLDLLGLPRGILDLLGLPGGVLNVLRQPSVITALKYCRGDLSLVLGTRLHLRREAQL